MSRPYIAIYLSGKDRPDEKGIETHSTLNHRRQRFPVGKTAPMKRGLKPYYGLLFSHSPSYRGKDRPDEKGIETSSAGQVAVNVNRVGKTAPMKRGLKQIAPIANNNGAVSGKDRPDEKGIETFEPFNPIDRVINWWERPPR